MKAKRYSTEEKISALLGQEGWNAGKRHIQSLRRSLGLRVPPTKRKVNREQFWTLTEARVVIEDFRRVPSEATSPSL